MKRKLLKKVHLCTQLDGEGKIWSVTTDGPKKGIAFFNQGIYSNSELELYKALETRIYDFYSGNPDAKVELPANHTVTLKLEQGSLFTKEVEFDGNVGKLLDIEHLLDFGQSMEGCSIIGKSHPNYERYLLVPPSKVLSGLNKKDQLLEKGEIVLISLEAKLCPYGTKWLASEVTTGKSGFVTLRDSRYLDEGSVIFTRYVDDREGKAIFKKPFKSTSDAVCDYLNVEVLVGHKKEGRALWDGNLMRIHSVLENANSKAKEALTNKQVLLDLQGERISETKLEKGVRCRIIGSRGDFYIADII